MEIGMATIYAFGSAPERAKEGYFLKGTVDGTDEHVLATYAGQDVCLVRGAAIFGCDGQWEFGVMFRDEPQYAVGDWGHIFEGETSEHPCRIVLDVTSEKLISLQVLNDRSRSETYRMPTRVEFDDVSDSILNANPEVFSAPADFGLLFTNELPAWIVQQ